MKNCTFEVPEKAKSGDRGRILLMDDEEGIRTVLSLLLQRNGFEVVTAKNGQDAFTLYRKALGEKRPFNVAILDLTVPEGMGGKETIQALREIDPEVKAIVSSGHCNDPVLAECRKFGFSGFVPKPFPFADLYSLIIRLMEEK